MGVPGEGLAGVHSAKDFVGWYNGLPSCQEVGKYIEIKDIFKSVLFCTNISYLSDKEPIKVFRKVTLLHHGSQNLNHIEKNIFYAEKAFTTFLQPFCSWSIIHINELNDFQSGDL